MCDVYDKLECSKLHFYFFRQFYVQIIFEHLREVEDAVSFQIPARNYTEPQFPHEEYLVRHAQRPSCSSIAIILL